MKEGWPEEWNLFPRLERVAEIGRSVGRFIFRMPQTLSSHGTHFVEPRGASEDLDHALYDNVTPLNRWDSEGRYLDPDDAA